MSNSGRVVVRLIDGSARRVTLSSATQVIAAKTEAFGPGVDLVGVWLVKGRVVVGSHSRWDAGRGAVQGTSWREADPVEVANLAARYDCDALVNLVPEL
jgi:hypothetical protein